MKVHGLRPEDIVLLLPPELPKVGPAPGGELCVQVALAPAGRDCPEKRWAVDRPDDAGSLSRTASKGPLARRLLGHPHRVPLAGRGSHAAFDPGSPRAHPGRGSGPTMRG